MTAQGHPRAIFQRAIERGSLALAETTARELEHIWLSDSLELVALIAQHDPARHRRAGARWVYRYLEENRRASLDDVAFIAGCLAALGGPEHQAALSSLRAVAKTASVRSRARDIR